MEKVNFIRTEAPIQIVTPVLPQQSYSSGWCCYGLDDHFGDQVYTIYAKSSILHALIDQLSSYFSLEYEDIIKSLIIYGAAPILITNGNNSNKRLYSLLDHRYLRVNCVRSKFSYKVPRSQKVIYEAWAPDKDGVLYLALDNDAPYPHPYIYPVLESLQVLNEIHNFNINELNNEFAPSVMISLLNGIPDDATRDEIERAFNAKFCGTSNAGRLLLNFAVDKDHAAQVDTIPVEDFASRWESLIKSSKEDVFLRFKTTASLLGIPQDHNGWNQEEYDRQKALYEEYTVKYFKRFIDKLIQLIS